MLQDYDQVNLFRLCEELASRRLPPATLGQKFSTYWAAALCFNGKWIDSAIFEPGDREDAVEVLYKRNKQQYPDWSNYTLCLSLEPSHTYSDLPPVTETIRKTGVRKVIVGTENPANKLRGLGVEDLRQNAIDVQIADGEVALACQLFYEDFGRASNGHLPLVKAAWDLDSRSDLKWETKLLSTSFPLSVDAVIISEEDMSRVRPLLGDEWLVILDADSIHGVRGGGAGSKVVRFLPKHSLPAKQMDRVFELEYVDQKLCLAKVLRKLHSLGLKSVVFLGDMKIIENAIFHNLVDEFISKVNTRYHSTESLAQLSSRKVVCDEWQDLIEAELSEIKLLDRAEQTIWVKSRVKGILEEF